ncbi:MAG: amidohydrolase family protein [Flavobacteriaceae bacterium]
MRYFGILLFILCFGCNSQSNKTIDLIISNVNIIDVITGDLIKNQDVIINNSKIISVSDHTENANYYKTKIDGSGKYLIPAFWDMHVHIQDSSYLEMFMDYGIVGVRDMGGCVTKPTDGCESLCPEILNTWKQKIYDNEIEGPELFISGQILSGTGWPTSLNANNIENVQKSFETILKNKIDFIKVYEQIPADAYKEIARLSKKNNIDFVGHVSESLLLSEISDLGQKSIEHLREQILYCFTNDPNELEQFMIEDSYTQEDREFVKPWVQDSEKAIEAFIINKTWFVPTMAVQFARQRFNDSLWVNNSLRNQLPESVKNSFSEHMINMENNPDKKGDSLWWMAHKKLVKRLNDKGVGLLAGSDIACEGGIPGFSLHEELKLMVEHAGLTPIEAIRTATINPAAYFNLTNKGLIKENFVADLILLDKNPLESISNTLTINKVIKSGKVYTNKN